MKRRAHPVLKGLFLTAVLYSIPCAAAEEVIDPHNTRMTECTDCHTSDIYTEDCHDYDGFCLVAESVDNLCLICHVKEECCRLGQDHQAQIFLGENSHPSDIDVGDVSSAHLPETLPIQDGRITCSTCHLHTRAEESDYKMLRLVKVEGKEVDWTALCADCHGEY